MVGAGIGSLMSPVLRAFLCFTAVWMFEWDNPECFRLWTAVAQLLRCCHGDWLVNHCCGKRPHLVKRQDGYSHIFPAVLRVSWIPPSEPLTLQPHQLPPSSRPDKLWCPPHPRSLTSEAGWERHPLTSSLIIRDGREPLWVLSNSIQEFSQPVQSSLDKLTNLPLLPTP